MVILSDIITREAHLLQLPTGPVMDITLLKFAEYLRSSMCGSNHLYYKSSPSNSPFRQPFQAGLLVALWSTRKRRHSFTSHLLRN